MERVKGKKFFLDPAALQPGLVERLAGHGMVQVACSDADVFIVKPPGQCGHRISLVSGLRGGYQVSPAIFFNQVGTTVKMYPAAATARIVLYPNLAKIGMQHSGSSWMLYWLACRPSGA